MMLILYISPANYKCSNYINYLTKFTDNIIFNWYYIANHLYSLAIFRKIRG